MVRRYIPHAQGFWIRWRSQKTKQQEELKNLDAQLLSVFSQLIISNIA